MPLTLSEVESDAMPLVAVLRPVETVVESEPTLLAFVLTLADRPDTVVDSEPTLLLTALTLVDRPDTEVDSEPTLLFTVLKPL
ncbi:hypothetical protein ACS0YY_34680, partial [Burkholderia gladioli]